MPEPSRAGSEEIKGGYNDKKENRKPSSERCPLCRNSHNLDVCERFNKMSRARKNGSCEVQWSVLRCLKYGYMKKDCRGRKICTPCKGFHPTSLHLDAPMAPQHNTKPAVPPASASTEATSHRINTHDPKNKHKLLQLPLVNCLCLVASQR